MSQPLLIGPVCAGKTTLLELVAPRLGKPALDLDGVADRYLGDVGRGWDALQAKGDEVGFLGSYRWWQEGFPHLLRRALEDHPDSLLALGAGHTHYLDPELQARADAILAPHDSILVLPSPDPKRSIEVLRRRCVEQRDMDWVMGGVDFIERWVEDPANHRLARWTVYTEGRTPEETADEVLELLGGAGYVTGSGGNEISRPSGRVILIGPGQRVLMFRGGDPTRPELGTWWFTPGGGADPGETPFQAAQRELAEETGQVEVEWGGSVGEREVRFEFMGNQYHSQESFFVAFTSSSEVAPQILTEIELAAIEEHRWLTTDDLAALAEVVYPAELASVLDRLAHRDLPKRPWRWSAED